MNRMIAAASAAVLSLTVAAGAAVAQDFRALAQQDLQAAHDALAANHPAAVISGAPSEAFRSWIDAGLTDAQGKVGRVNSCLLYTSPSPRDLSTSRMPSSA